MNIYALFLSALLLFSVNGVYAESYRIDTTGGHASINFRIKHLLFTHFIRPTGQLQTTKLLSRVARLALFTIKQ